MKKIVLVAIAIGLIACSAKEEKTLKPPPTPHSVSPVPSRTLDGLLVRCSKEANPNARQQAYDKGATSVQTLVENLRENRFSWPVIRGRKLPFLLKKQLELLSQNQMNPIDLECWQRVLIGAIYQQTTWYNYEYEGQCLREDDNFMSSTMKDLNLTLVEAEGPCLQVDLKQESNR